MQDICNKYAKYTKIGAEHAKHKNGELYAKIIQKYAEYAKNMQNMQKIGRIYAIQNSFQALIWKCKRKKLKKIKIIAEPVAAMILNFLIFCIYFCTCFCIILCI